MLDRSHVIPFAKPEPDKCSQCGKAMKKHVASNDPAYCSDYCGAKAQPEHTSASMVSGADGRK